MSAPSRISIVSDGTSEGTIVEVDGQIIDSCIRVMWEVSVGGLPMVSITYVLPGGVTTNLRGVLYQDD